MARTWSIVLLVTTSLLVASCEADSKKEDPCLKCAAWQNCQNETCAINLSSQWNVIAVRATISERNSGGDAWDVAGGLPDPFICMTVNGSRNCTTGREDTLSPTFNERVATAVGAGALMGGFAVAISDEDLTANDLICEGNTTVEEAYFGAGGFKLTCTENSTVMHFDLQFVQ